MNMRVFERTIYMNSKYSNRRPAVDGILLVVFCLVCSACDSVGPSSAVLVDAPAIVAQQPGSDSLSIAIRSDDVLTAFGQDRILRRSEDFRMTADQLPLVKFVGPEKRITRDRLVQMAALVIGGEVKNALWKEESDFFSVKLENGLAYSEKNTGSAVIHRIYTNKHPTSLEGAEDAVNRALEEVVENSLLTLHPDETLDIVSITSTHYAIYGDDAEGNPASVRFQFNGENEAVSEFQDEYMVHFGRRFRGVPVIGQTLGVKLDADGNLISFQKRWRDIASESGKSTVFSLRSANDIFATAEDQLKKAEQEEVESMQCGYVEGDASFAQSEAGIGCQVIVRNFDVREAMSSNRVVWVNASTADHPLFGKKIEFVSGNTIERPLVDDGAADVMN